MSAASSKLEAVISSEAEVLFLPTIGSGCCLPAARAYICGIRTGRSIWIFSAASA